MRKISFLCLAALVCSPLSSNWISAVSNRQPAITGSPQSRESQARPTQTRTADVEWEPRERKPGHAYSIRHRRHQWK